MQFFCQVTRKKTDWGRSQWADRQQPCITMSQSQPHVVSEKQRQVVVDVTLKWEYTEHSGLFQWLPLIIIQEAFSPCADLLSFNFQRFTCQQVQVSGHALWESTLLLLLLSPTPIKTCDLSRKIESQSQLAFFVSCPKRSKGPQILKLASREMDLNEVTQTVNWYQVQLC